jgi:hypothetical protein
MNVKENQTKESTENEDLVLEIRKLREAIKKYAPNESLWHRFLLGLMNGFGTVVGATLLVYLAVLILNQLTGIPVLDQFIERVIEIVQRKS